MNTALRQQNRELVGKLLVIVAGMLGFAYLMVPIYKQVCKATGIELGPGSAVNIEVQAEVAACRLDPGEPGAIADRDAKKPPVPGQVISPVGT